MLRPLHFLFDGRIGTTRPCYVLFEVGDLATHGTAVQRRKHGETPEDLQVRQMEEYYNSEDDCASRTMIQDQSYGFHIHQFKFVRERLTPIVIRKDVAQTRNQRQVMERTSSCEPCVGFRQLGSARDPSRCVSFGITWNGVLESEHRARCM